MKKEILPRRQRNDKIGRKNPVDRRGKEVRYLKVLVLGGCGNMGREAVRTLLLEEERVEKVTVADINLDRAQKFVETLEDPRAEALRVDVTDRKKLIESLGGNDLVLNTVGPFYRFALPVAEAAIEARVNYMDICDDIEPTIEILKLDRDARDAGIFVLLGMGASPGLTNLIAKELTNQLDEVEEIVTAWVVGEEIEREKVKFSEGLGVMEHMFHISTGEIVTFRGGRHTKIPAFQEGLEIPFPKPIGPHTCYHVAHPEVVTLPDYVSGVRTVSNLGSLYPPLSNEAIRMFKDDIESGKRSIQDSATILRRFDELERMAMEGMGEVEPRLGGLYVSAIGTKDGERGQQYFGACSATPMSEDTGQPLACAALYFARGGEIDPGAHPPEKVFGIDDIMGLGGRYDLSFVGEEKTEMEMGWSEEVISAEKT